MRLAFSAWLVISSISIPAAATIFGTVRGTIRDEQQRPVAQARVTLRGSALQLQTKTDDLGAFVFQAIPIGVYILAAEVDGRSQQRTVQISSNASITAALVLPARPFASETITVTAAAVDSRAATTQTTIDRVDVQRTPGADRANSLAMITSFVPSATLVHDQLHIRGGHQTEWFIDGVPVPNTNIASNVGPQFDPRDLDTVEVQRGGYSAEYGDRSYGVLNVLPRSGFGRQNEAHLILNGGSYRSTDDQINFGSHTDRFAYYGSASFNRTDHALETPVSETLHDKGRGSGVFASLVFLRDARNQFRLAAAGRLDHYEVPNDASLQSAGIDDVQRETDAFANVSWLHTISPATLITVAPYVHINSTDFEGGPRDPIIIRDRRRSTYYGGEVVYTQSLHANDARFGVSAFAQNDSTAITLRSDEAAIADDERPSGSVISVFATDRLDLTKTLTLTAGARYTRFRGLLGESSLSPRIGVSQQVRSHIVLRAAYTDTYQPPPLTTIAGPLLEFAIDEGLGFIPLHGERDRQVEVGAAMTAGGWNSDFASFRTDARNFFDHDALGNANIFFPLTIARVHIRGIEVSLRSPSIGRARLHLAYAHQTVQGEGAVTGGLTDFSPAPDRRFLLDHDQRDTFSAGGTFELTRGAWAAATVSYGSGFLRQDGPEHLPPHTTFDLAAAVPFGAWTMKGTLLNVANRRYLLDESNTFAGTHYNDPRSVSFQVEYRFRY